VGAALGLTFLARVPSLLEPRWYSDEGILAAVAAGMLQGRRLYAQVWDNQGPFVYGWMAAVLAVTRDFHPAMQLVLTAQVLVAAAALAVAAARMRGRPAGAALTFGLVTSVPVLEGDIQNTELIALPLLCVAAALVLRPGRARALVAGGLVGAAGLCRPSFGIDGLALAWLLLAMPGRRSDLAPFAGGGAAAVAVTVLALAAGGSWAAYQETLRSDSLYLAWANGGGAWQGLFLLRQAPLLLALGAGIWLGAWRRTPATLLLGAWLPLALLGSVMSARGFNHYALEAVAPLALLVSLQAGAILAIPAAAAAVVVLQYLEYYPAAVLGAFHHPAPTMGRGTAFDWQRLDTYYERVWEGSRASGPAGLFEDAQLSERLTVVIRPLPAGPLEVWDQHPWLYVETGRPPAERYVAHNSAWRLIPGHEQESVALVEQSRPAVLVVDDRVPPDLAAWVGAHCNLVSGQVPEIYTCR